MTAKNRWKASAFVVQITAFMCKYGTVIQKNFGMSTDCPMDFPRNFRNSPYSSNSTGPKTNCAFPSAKSRLPIRSSWVITPNTPLGSFVTP